ncbi:UNKNOWN [Stylonychia lemnae]|uniref:Uncharacterized protein n=1 Tax=Stylonychia lemnae TaxID=5949 RepID=A0A078ARK9_STYLE|nr:UNKNOWN [Stylonychia lemnae]|eukprot:CDW85105.1 UNKNOWN [Stylonychia lemnae]
MPGQLTFQNFKQQPMLATKSTAIGYRGQLPPSILPKFTIHFHHCLISPFISTIQMGIQGGPLQSFSQQFFRLPEEQENRAMLDRWLGKILKCSTKGNQFICSYHLGCMYLEGDLPWDFTKNSGLKSNGIETMGPQQYGRPSFLLRLNPNSEEGYLKLIYNNPGHLEIYRESDKDQGNQVNAGQGPGKSFISLLFVFYITIFVFHLLDDLRQLLPSPPPFRESQMQKWLNAIRVPIQKSLLLQLLLRTENLLHYYTV